MKIKIVIVGLGGVGGYYGGLLAKKYLNNPEIEIYFLSRGANLKKVQENGLKVITENETFTVHPQLATDSLCNVGQADYVILTTKSYDLEATINQIKPCISKNTVVLPLLNGANISENIRELLPDIQVWDGCVYIVGRLIEPGVVESSGGVHDLFFGAEQGDKIKLKFMHQLFLDAGIKSNLRDDIRMIIWRKFIFISVTASLTSYFNVGFRDLLTDAHRHKTTICFLEEIISVAESVGIKFDFDILKTTINQIEKLPENTTSSMHSDFLAGRNAEVETLTGIVTRIGSKNAIKTPIYDLVYTKLKTKIKN